MSIESVMPSSHLILCRPLLLLPPIHPSIRGFSSESALHIRWPKYWSSSFSISPSNEHPGLISFRMDWLDLLAVQGTLKSLLQHHSSKHLYHSHQLGNSRGLRRSAKHGDKDQICISYYKSQYHKMYDYVIHQNCFRCIVFLTTIKMSMLQSICLLPFHTTWECKES